MCHPDTVFMPQEKGPMYRVLKLVIHLRFWNPLYSWIACALNCNIACRCCFSDPSALRVGSGRKLRGQNVVDVTDSNEREHATLGRRLLQQTATSAAAAAASSSTSGRLSCKAVKTPEYRRHAAERKLQQISSIKTSTRLMSIGIIRLPHFVPHAY